MLGLNNSLDHKSVNLVESNPFYKLQLINVLSQGVWEGVQNLPTPQPSLNT